MRKVIVLFLVFLFGLSFCEAQGTSFQAKVVGIKDGDTFKVLYNKEEYTIRLTHIDCPEKNQAFGTKAKQLASELCFGKEVKVVSSGKDRYKRILAEVFVGDVCVNQELVKQGLAWHFKKFSKNKNYEALEQQARRQKKGLWSDDCPIAPWEWRKKKRKNSKNKSSLKTISFENRKDNFAFFLSEKFNNEFNDYFFVQIV